MKISLAVHIEIDDERLSAEDAGRIVIDGINWLTENRGGFVSVQTEPVYEVKTGKAFRQLLQALNLDLVLADILTDAIADDVLDGLVQHASEGGDFACNEPVLSFIASWQSKRPHRPCPSCGTPVEVPTKGDSLCGFCAWPHGLAVGDPWQY